MNDHDSFTTDQMEQALRALQRVRSFDFNAAYEAAYGGISGIDPRTSDAAAALIYGRSLAFRVWARRCTLTLDAQHAALVSA